MATKNVGAARGRTKKSKKVNKKDIVKKLIPFIAVATFIYILYKIIELIVVPTDIVMIENGTIFNEESAIRICNKK